MARWDLQHSFGAGDIIGSSPLHSEFQCNCQSLESTLRPKIAYGVQRSTSVHLRDAFYCPSALPSSYLLVVIVDALEYIDMKGDSSSLSKRLENMGNHFTGECSDLFPLQVQVDVGIGPTGDIDNRS